MMTLWGAMLEGIGVALIIPIFSYNDGGKTKGVLSDIIFNIIGALGLEKSMTGILVLLAGVFAIKGIFVIGQKSILVKIQTDLKRELRLDMIQRYASMTYSYYVNGNIGYMNNLITVEIDRVVKAFMSFSGVVASILYVGIYISGAVMLNYKLTCIIFSICGLFFYAAKNLQIRSRELSIATSNRNADVQSTLIQLIYSFKYLKASASFGKLIDKLKADISRVAKFEFTTGLLGVLTQALIEPFAVMFICGIVFYYVEMLNRSVIEIGVLIIFLYRTFNRTLSLQSVWQRFNALVGGVETLKNGKAGLDANVERNGKMSIDGIDKTISLKNVNFAYGNKQVLFNVNLDIEQNKSIGIVGESGAGKTTLFDLITGLLTPQLGYISLGNLSYVEVDKEKLRSIIGYVTQEPVIFNDTIANNISFWECESLQDGCLGKIEAAAKLAHCEDFICECENGYETIIGDRGIKLSGGQRQRIAIAREIFKEPEILIFDEATSSLDSESEKHIQDSISELKGKRTIVIIAHRLSTIRNCDYIYVLKNGCIVEEGKFDELHSFDGGVFRKMCLEQSL